MTSTLGSAVGERVGRAAALPAPLAGGGRRRRRRGERARLPAPPFRL